MPALLGSSDLLPSWHALPLLSSATAMFVLPALDSSMQLLLLASLLLNLSALLATTSPPVTRAWDGYSAMIYKLSSGPQ